MTAIIVQPSYRREQQDTKKLAALAGIRDLGTIAEGSRAARVSRSTIRDWRMGDEDFDTSVKEALEDYRDSLTAEITRRGRDGYDEPVIHQGQICYRTDIHGVVMLDDDFEPIILTIKKHSDRLLELNAKAFDDRYRDRSSLEVTGSDGGPLETAITVTYVLPDGRVKEDYETLIPLPDEEPAKELEFSEPEPAVPDPLD